METNVYNVSAPGGQKTLLASDARPRVAIIVIAVWIFLQMIRITAFSLVQSVLAGTDAAAWLYPAFVDIFVGITAPFVAFALWRKTGLAVWVAAIVWFAISIFDHMDAMTASLTTQIPASMPGGGNVSITVMVLLVLTILDVIALTVLTRKKMRSYYLAK